MCGSLSPRLISTLYLLMDRVLRRGWYPLAYPCQKGAQTLLPRAPRRSYRERFWGGCVRALALSEKGGGLHGERGQSRRPGVYQLVVSRME